MFTAFYYTKQINENNDIDNLAQKYCVRIDRVKDLREMLIKGSGTSKYLLIVDYTTIRISQDLISYMVHCGGNSKLMGVIIISNDSLLMNCIDNNKVFNIILNEKFKVEFVDKLFRINDNFSSPCESVECEIGKLLEQAKIMPKYVGYGYIKDAVSYTLSQDGSLSKLNSVVYPYIATKYSTTINNVERNIRIAIASAWKKENDCFGFNKKPSNKALIAYMVNNLKNKII